jgi:hypothetical protein
MDAASTSAIDDKQIVATFNPGPIGIRFNHEGEILQIKGESQADQIFGLSKGDLIIKVGGISVLGFTLLQINEHLTNAPRPVILTFQRHTSWVRNNHNGLPQYDHEMLQMLFDTFALGCGNHITESANGPVNALNSEGLVELMKEVHEMAIAFTGKDMDELEEAYDHAKDLIDAHDENDDGLLDFEELKLWLDKNMSMGEEERLDYSKRGGYCPDSVRFVEDVAHGLHIDEEPTDENFDAALPEHPDEIARKEAERVAWLKKQQEEMEQQRKEELEATDQQRLAKLEAQANLSKEEIRQQNIKEAVAQREQDEKEREEYTSKNIIPGRKNSLKAIQLPPGCREQVKELLSQQRQQQQQQQNNSVYKHDAILTYTTRACLALSSGICMKHLQLTEEFVMSAVKNLLNATDNVMRGAVVEFCLNNIRNNLFIEDLEPDEMLDSMFVHFNRERVQTLIGSMKLEDVDLQHKLMIKCMKAHSEKDRYMNLVDILEAVAEPTEFEFMEMTGISRIVDDKHRYALMATVDRLSLTLNEERTSVINQAISESVTWAQLAEVLEGIIAYKPNDAILMAAAGDGLCCRNRPRLTLLREHVRCSMMMPHGRETYHKVENKLEAALTSFDLVDVLMLILNRYGESLVHLNESRNKNKSVTNNGYGNNGSGSDSKGAGAGDGGGDGSGNGSAGGRSGPLAFQTYSTNGNAMPKKKKQNEVQQELTGLKQAQRDEYGQLAALMSGTLTADQFSKTVGKKKNSNDNNQQRPPPPPGLPTTRRLHSKKASLKPLKLLSSSVRASVAMMFDMMNQTMASSNPIAISDLMSLKAMKTLNNVCVTIAGAAKLLLVVFHPRLSSNDKMKHLESAGLASMNTDVDRILDGEKRLLKSIVTLYMGKRTSSPESNAAHRAVDSATRKLDIVEILHVMVISCGRMQSVAAATTRQYTPVSKTKARKKTSLPSTNAGAGGAAARGNNFFDGDDDTDDVLCDGRASATAKTATTATTRAMAPGSNNSGNQNEWGEDEKEFDVMQKLPQNILFQPSPPPSKPPQGSPRTTNGKKIRIRGPKGLRNVRSLKKNRAPGPPSALNSYQGIQTMWSVASEDKNARSSGVLNFE